MVNFKIQLLFATKNSSKNVSKVIGFWHSKFLFIIFDGLRIFSSKFDGAWVYNPKIAEKTRHISTRFEFIFNHLCHFRSTLTKTSIILWSQTTTQKLEAGANWDAPSAVDPAGGSSHSDVWVSWTWLSLHFDNAKTTVWHWEFQKTKSNPRTNTTKASKAKPYWFLNNYM